MVGHQDVAELKQPIFRRWGPGRERRRPRRRGMTAPPLHLSRRCRTISEGWIAVRRHLPVRMMYPQPYLPDSLTERYAGSGFHSLFLRFCVADAKHPLGRKL